MRRKKEKEIMFSSVTTLVDTLGGACLSFIELGTPLSAVPLSLGVVPFDCALSPCAARARTRHCAAHLGARTMHMARRVFTEGVDSRTPMTWAEEKSLAAAASLVIARRASLSSALASAPTS